MPSGGKRKGAGRKPNGDKAKVQMTVHVDEKTKTNLLHEAGEGTVGKVLDRHFGEIE